MSAEIINIGSEFLAGRVSKSSPLISCFLSSLGIDINKITTVGDRMEAISESLCLAKEKSDIIVLCGGMGVSSGYVAREALKKNLGMESGFSREAMENVAAFFAKSGKDVPSCCDSQAYIIRGARVLPNSRGSCPGQYIESPGAKSFIVLPGDYEEVESIFKKSLLNILKERYERGIRKTSVIHIAGLYEGELARGLNEVVKNEKHLEEGDIDFYFESTPSGTDIHVSVRGEDEILVDEMIHKAKAGIYSVALNDIYGEDGQTLQEAVGRLLAKKKKRIAVAESCTGGMLSSILTDVPGSSVYFDRGVVAYSIKAKKDVLGVSGDTIKSHSAVSAEVAVEMAENVCRMSGSDISISITGYAGPSSGKDKKAGVAYSAIHYGDVNEVFEIKFSGSRTKLKEKFSYFCIEKLWRVLKN